METNICKNCNYQTNDDFCSKCGHPVKLKKIDRDFIISEIKSALFTEKGFFYTTKRIFLSPGDSVRHYIKEDRSRYVKPITYLIIASLIYTFVNYLLKIDYFMQLEAGEFSTPNYFRKLILENRGYASIVIDLYIALWIKLFFKKSEYNFFEIFILMCFISGVKALLISVAIILQALVHTDIIMISLLIPLIYSFWAIGQFFGKRKVKSYLKVILAYIVGMISLGFIVSVVTIIEVLIRQQI